MTTLKLEHPAVAALRNVVLNARVQPDASMAGTTDCYAVPLDDIDSGNAALTASAAYDEAVGECVAALYAAQETLAYVTSLRRFEPTGFGGKDIHEVLDEAAAKIAKLGER